MQEDKQIDATVIGIVQGVSFRYYTQREALRLGVKGWVTNQRDGSVRVVAQGSEATLFKFIEFLHRGSPIARVERVAVSWEAAVDTFSGFQIRYL